MQPEFIICEQSGEWAAAWRRMTCGSPSNPAPREVRSLDECRQAMEAAKAGFALVELTFANVADVLGWLDWLQFRCPAARAAILASHGCEAYEPLARELGAVHFVDSPRRLKPLVAVVERYLAELPALEESLGEEIWRQLPWKSAAVAGPGTFNSGQGADTNLGAM